jgi:hypothetical protein
MLRRIRPLTAEADSVDGDADAPAATQGDIHRGSRILAIRASI